MEKIHYDLGDITEVVNAKPMIYLLNQLMENQNEIIDWLEKTRASARGVQEYHKELVAEKQAKQGTDGKITDKINKLLRLEREIGLLGRRPARCRELLFTLSSKAYKQLNKECDAKRLGQRPCEIRSFFGQHGKARILEDEQQTDDVLAYYRSG